MYTEYVVGKDGERVKGEAEIQKQGQLVSEIQPEEIQHKYQQTGRQNPVNSNNERLYDQSRDPNQTSLLDAIAETENNPG